MEPVPDVRDDGGAPRRPHGWCTEPRRSTGNVESLSYEQTKELQQLLKRRGLEVGEIDGKLGAGTRKAVKEMQVKFGLPADSYPTAELLNALRGRNQSSLE